MEYLKPLCNSNCIKLNQREEMPRQIYPQYVTMNVNSTFMSECVHEYIPLHNSLNIHTYVHTLG